MCEVTFITKNETFKEILPSLEAVMDRVASIPELLGYRCFQVSGKRRRKSKERIVK